MADNISVQMLAFKFASGNYAYKSIAQKMNELVAGFSFPGTLFQFLLCLASQNCIQYLDCIGDAAKKIEQLLPSTRDIFTGISQSELNP